MWQFDVGALRERLRAVYGVPRDLARNLDECARKGTLAVATTSILISATKSLVAGWLEPIPELLAKCEKFALATIEQNSGSTFERAITYRDLGFCRWLQRDRNDDETFELMAEQYARYPFKDWHSLEYNLVNLVGGQQYEAALKLVKDGELEPPRTWNDCDTSPHYAYLFAANHGRDEKVLETKSAVERFVSQTVLPKLFPNGHWIEGAMWMKIARWSKGTSARDAVPSCLEFEQQDG